MTALKEKKEFPSYTELKPVLPQWFWNILRIATLLLTTFVIYTLFVQPELGLTLFWKLLIPLLPLSFALVPGLWRNICPMAFLNQLPRMFGVGLQLTLPGVTRQYALLISIIAFVVFITSRAPLLNHSGVAVGIMLISVFVLALVGGLVFKGRSGWCGTFCPMAPLEKIYGHAPLLMVRNGYCEPCIGCQKNCYDFNPRAAIFSDLGDSETWWSDNRKFFAAMLPGLIIGFFNSIQPGEAGNYTYYLSILTPPLITIGLYHTMRNLFQFSDYKQVALFGLAALSIFYWYGTPVVASGIEQVFGVSLPDSAISLIRGAAVLVCVAVFIRGLISERLYRQTMLVSKRATIVDGVKVLKAVIEKSGDNAEVMERASGRRFEVRSGYTLLDALEVAELPIIPGCRTGMCGSDPVVVIEGSENLPPPDETEVTTLKRLGLEGKARLACCCKPTGNIAIDLDADPSEFDVKESSPGIVTADVDAEQQFKVIIIGNGIAGISTAESLREINAKCSISLISKEPHHFYNRMGLEQVIYGRAAMQGLYLMKEEWYQRNSIDVWLNTQVESIDRKNNQIVLATDERLLYDKLVLATGGHAFVPPVQGFDMPGCFTLRNAEDAIYLRAWIQKNKCKKAVVLGGGILGVEAANALRELGLRVVIIHRSHQLMDIQLDLHAGVILKQFLENSGIKVFNSTGIKHADGEERIKSVLLSNGDVMATDLLLICTGIRSNIQLAEDSGLDVNKGVVVDEYMCTSDNDIYCVGDAAELPGSVSGLWAVGSEQGKVAAAHILGEKKSYTGITVPPVQLKVAGIDVKSFGKFEEDDRLELYSSGNVEEHRWKHIVVKEGKITGGVFVNSPQAASAAMAAIKNSENYLSKDAIDKIMEKN